MKKFKLFAFLCTFVLVAAPGIVSAVATGNLLLTEQKTVEFGPDLSVVESDLSVNKNAIKPGMAVTFKALVKNLGTDKAQNFKVLFFFGETQIYEKNVSALAKNSQTSITKTYTIPSSIIGSQEFLVKVDPENKVAETSEENNQAEKKIEILEADKPDLAIIASDLGVNKQSMMGGDSVVFKAVVKNLGLATAKNFMVRLFLNSSQIYEKTFPTISKNGRTTITYTYQLPSNMNGAQIFKAVVDPENKITETDEKNNEAEKTINVTKAGRDLSIEYLKPSQGKPKVGQQINWQIKVKNTGTAKAENIKVNFYGDNTSASPTASLVIPNIPKNGSTIKVVKWTIPAGISPAVNYTVRAVVDPDNTIDETNETNNTQTAKITLTAPDLKIEKGTNGYVAAPIYKGVRLAQWGKVTNDNVMPVNNVKVALYYYTGSDSSNPIKIAEQNLGTLGKKAVRDVYLQSSSALFDSLNLGTTIHVLMKVDYNNEIVETNEDNNLLEATRTLTEKPRTVQYPYLRIYVNDENGDPKNGATVKITNTATSISETKNTGVETFYYSTGNVIFESRPTSAAYRVEVSAPGYRTNTRTITFDSSNDNTIEHTFDLDKKALVSGTIKNQSGQNLAWVLVKIEGTNLETMTDAQGKFAFLLNGGTYTLRLVRDGYSRIVETITATPLTTLVFDRTMTPATTAYVFGTVTDDEGNPLSNVDVYVNGQILRVTGADGKFSTINTSAGSKKFTFKKPGFVSTEFTENIVAGKEYDFSLALYKPSTDTHIERGTEFVAWHQHEGTPANAFFIPEYSVDVWWGLGRIKMGLDFTKNDSGAKLNKLTISNHGLSWECNKVEGEGEIETSAIDIPLTISAGSCANQATQIDVYKVAIESNGAEVWSDATFWSSASDPLNTGTKTFTLNNLAVSWNNNFKIKMWLRVQKKSVVGTDGEGSGALTGYHLDKQLVTWYPQKPPTTKIKTSWSQIGGYLLGILDNPANAISNFTDLFTAEQFNQYSMEAVLPQNFPGYISD